MTTSEFSNEFDVLYNNIMSNAAPGLDEYEKSIFLTKGQDEVLKNYFNPKGNKYTEGFDGNPKRQVDFSMLTNVATTSASSFKYTLVEDVKDAQGNAVYTRVESTPATPVSTESYTVAYDSQGKPMESSTGDIYYIKNTGTDISGFGDPIFDTRSNTKSITLPTKMLFSINEMVEVSRDSKTILLQVIPIKFDEYTRLMCKPYKRPLKYQAWRLINSDTVNKADIIVGPSDILTKYTIRYIRRPNPIILTNLDTLSIGGISNISECELDPILHEEILQRAVELAKAAYTGDINSQIQMGQRSE